MDNLESAWLEAAKRGDADAFSYLVEKYQKPVFNLCYRMLGNANDAEDAAQESFLKAYKSLKSYDLARPFATWILSIASHYCIDQIRKKKFQTFSFDDDAYAWLEPKDPKMSPELMAMAKERQEQVQNLLSHLAPKDRAAVILYYWYAYSYQEIADVLSLTVSAVKSRLHRARRSMALVWEKTQDGQVLEVGRRDESSAL